MRNMILSLVPVVALGLLLGHTRPADAADKFTREQKQTAQKSAGSVNGVCPVSGKLVTAQGGKAVYKGERISFNSPASEAKFKADPTRYMDRMRLNPPKYWYLSSKPSVVDLRKAKAAQKSANGGCPSTGKPVIPKGGSTKYKGQRIAFCCPSCAAKFKADPEKPMRKLRADPLAYAYDRPGPTNAEMRVARRTVGCANGRCPVMGKKVVAKGGSSTYRGEKIGFCCPPCEAKFTQDPEKYMARMRNEPAAYGYVPGGK